MSQQGAERTVTLDDPAVLLGGIFVVYLGTWALWYFAHKYIALAYTYVRYVQVSILHAVGTAWPDAPGVGAVYRWVEKTCAPSSAFGACQRDFASMPWSEIADSTFVFNGLFLLIVVGWCVKLFLRANTTHPKLNFIKKHNLASFVRESMRLYPHLRVFSRIDLIAEPLDHPVFGMSLTSRQFVFAHRLISGWKEETDGTWTPTLDRVLATKVFRRQLGKHWTRSDDLSPAETLLVAIAIPRVAATDPALDDQTYRAALKASEDMILWCWDQFKPPAPDGKKKRGDLASDDPWAWLRPSIDLTLPRKVIKQYIEHPNVTSIIEHHAFNRTIIIALYHQARRLGVLPPADMRWMRFFDRELWYLLETIGRQAGFAEAAAVLSHFLYEAKAGMAIVEPQLDKAVNGLETAVTSFKFLAADKLRYEQAAPKQMTTTALSAKPT